MRLAQRHIRGIAALCLAVHVVAGLLATFAHDHGGAAACCGVAARAAACAGADDAHGAVHRGPAGKSCRRQACGHTPPGAVQGDGELPRQAAASRLSLEADLQARCLACEFLAGAIAILPWTPAVGPAAERWDDPAPARQMPRAAVIAASFARGPPA